MLDRFTHLFLQRVAQTLFKYATAINHYLSTQNRPQCNPDMTDSKDTPPAHWLEKVKQGAPHLLEQMDDNFDSHSNTQTFTKVDIQKQAVNKKHKQQQPHKKNNRNETPEIVAVAKAMPKFSEHNSVRAIKKTTAQPLIKYLRFFKDQTINAKQNEQLKTIKNKIDYPSMQTDSINQQTVPALEQDENQTIHGKTTAPLKTVLNIKAKPKSSKTNAAQYEKKVSQKMPLTEKTFFHLYPKQSIKNHHEQITEIKKCSHHPADNTKNHSIAQIKTVSAETLLATKNSALFSRHPLKQKTVIQQHTSLKADTAAQNQDHGQAHSERFNHSAATQNLNNAFIYSENQAFTATTEDRWPALPDQHELQTQENQKQVRQQFWQLQQQAKFNLLSDQEQRGVSWSE